MCQESECAFLSIDFASLAHLSNRHGSAGAAHMDILRRFFCMGKTSQHKGRAGELELCRILNDYGIAAVPGEALNYGTEPDIKGVAGVHAEVKRHERIEIGAWTEQAERDAACFGGWPCVFYRRNRERWRVAMPLEAWIEMYKAWRDGGHEQ